MQTIIYLTLLLAVAAVALSQSVYVNILTPQKQAGTVVSNARGVGITAYDPTSKVLSYYILHNVGSPTQAHIHIVSTAAVAFVLSSSTSPIQGTQTLTDAQASLLPTGGLYYNVHSTQFGAGEIRSDIVDEGYNYYARLDFAATAATTGSSPARGIAIAKFVAPSTLMVTVVHNAMNVTAAHIHKEAECKSGGVVQNFGLTGHTTNFTSTFTLTTDQVTDLKNNMFYVNVHTTAYPAGEIRGQLFPVGKTLIAAKDCKAMPAAASSIVTSLSVVLMIALASVLLMAF